MMKPDTREKEKDKPEFDITDRGYNVKAWYLKDTEKEKGDALVEVRKGEELLKQFIFPAYKIWNIAAHFKDIVDSEEERNIEGYKVAASNGLDGNIVIYTRMRTSIEVTATSEYNSEASNERVLRACGHSEEDALN